MPGLDRLDHPQRWHQPRIREHVQGLAIVRNQVDPVTWLAREIAIDTPGNAEILRVSLHGDDPQAIAVIVNAVVDAYMAEVVSKEKDERLERHNQLEKLHLETQESIRTKRGNLKRLAEALGSGDSQALTLKQQIALQQFAEIAVFSLSWFAGAIELVFGALVVLGLFTRFSAFILSGEMAFAYFIGHAAKSFYPVLNGGGFAALFCFVFLYIAAAGGGPWSLDRLIEGRRKG